MQELVKIHGGTVSVESEVGRGSTFTVAIPAGKDHLPAERIGAENALASTAMGYNAFVEEAMRWLPDTDEKEPGAKQKFRNWTLRANYCVGSAKKTVSSGDRVHGENTESGVRTSAGS